MEFLTFRDTYIGHDVRVREMHARAHVRRCSHFAKDRKVQEKHQVLVCPFSAVIIFLYSMVSILLGVLINITMTRYRPCSDQSHDVEQLSEPGLYLVSFAGLFLRYISRNNFAGSPTFM